MHKPYPLSYDLLGDKMEKIKVGIPRALYYYYYGKLYQYFFEKLGFQVVISPKTNKQIVDKGSALAESEMCLPMKILLGHIDFLKDKCDYIVLPRIDNFGLEDQTCTNFLALFDIVHNLFSIPILHYNVDEMHKKGEMEGFIHMANHFYIDMVTSMKAYEEAKELVEKDEEEKYKKALLCLKKDTRKIMLVSHPYNLEDNMIGKDIIDYLQKSGITIIKSYDLDRKNKNQAYKKITKNLYWHFSKQEISSLVCAYPSINGVIFLSSFPCALDSLVYELVMRKIKKPYLYLVMDDIHAKAGMETRLESFLDILAQY